MDDMDYYNEPVVETFKEYGTTFDTVTVHLDDGTDVVHVRTVRRVGFLRRKVETLDRFEGYQAQEAASAFISAMIEVLDPQRPSLEERLAPFGEEWQREQEERRNGEVPF